MAMVSDICIVFLLCIAEQICGALTVRLLQRYELFLCLSYFPALVFDPDRFLDDRLQKYLLPNPTIFCPFNVGPRTCLGQQVCSHAPFKHI